ncbi:MAG: M23 family metallopeptidase [Sphingomonas sp.]|uniref:M23 family metallopeptidase n=1 Tax=Sphingomonas sp. TaxID=28214 RepID=UPI001AC9D914|nr:M23 family metallopeptidase [Sphingomonas sp.]MBN8807559.1 M23 family metallopeptidase [Sphingomonas sp.]
MRTKLWIVMALPLSACIPAGRYDPADAAPPPPPAPRAVDEQPAPMPDYRDPAPAQDYPAERYDPDRIDPRIPAPPSAPPAWVARPVTPDARTIPDQTYTVEPGDSLRRIAERVGASADVIAAANDLAPPFAIRAGQELRIPGGRYHLIRPGESGIAIARAYGVKWADIVDANRLEEPYTLRAGQRVLIPGGGAPARPPQTLAERAAAFRIDLGDIATGGGEPAIAENDRPPPAPTKVRAPLPSSVPIDAPLTLNGPFQWPTTGGQVVKRFGAGASGERNDGIKIAVPLGTPVKAAADGTVIYTATGIAGLGGLVMVKHGDGWTSVYGYLGRILVQRGQAVRRGQQIAQSGQTGFADRPELHFELRKGRAPVDPLTKLSRR